MAINIPVSWGELVDKITILEIKLDRIHDDDKQQNISRELQALQSVFDQGCEHPQKIIQIKAKLRAVNEQLWDIEDDIRKCEKEKDFSQRFIDLARSVYMTNDRRADLKREINTILQSELFEEKSYEDYS
jgi:predicted  nucleic acid-binding Zn-ribbon protein